MLLEKFKEELSEFAKDTVLNIGSLLNEQDVDDLSAKQIAQIALASAYCTKQEVLIEAIQQYAEKFLNDTEVENVKVAASLMAMTNVYYRFIHIVSDPEFKTLPAKLRMNKMNSPSIDKIDFELCAIAVSAINNCQLCVDSHVSSLKKHGASILSIQTAVRIAAIMNAAAQSWVIN
jgi:alkyl hydroperoxide reductase subunit D